MRQQRRRQRGNVQKSNPFGVFFSSMTPQQLAEACAAPLWAPDVCSQWLGMLFSLADTTFAFAANSRNAPAVTTGGSIEYLKPVQGGDTLTAEGEEQTLAGRHGIYDVRLCNAAGETVAMFRGRAAQRPGKSVAAP